MNVYNISFILLHHTAKGQKGLNALRGSGDFAAFADSVLMFNPLGNNTVRIDFDKNRYVDTSKLSNFTFTVENDDEEETISLKFQGINMEDKGKRDEAIDLMLDWLKEKNSEQFKSQELKAYLINNCGFKKNVYYDALSMIKELGYISQKSDKSRTKKGYYFIDNSKFLDSNITTETIK